MKRIFFALVLALGVIVHPHVVSTQATPRTYLLAEGATGPFFDTDILLANPHGSTVPVNLTFFKEDGSTVSQDVSLPATSRTTIRVDNIAGLEATAFSTIVTSSTGAEIIVERTMRWDSSGYGAHTEKATAGAATEWFFAEGSQGFFFTYLLLVNPQSTPNVAHVTFLREGAPPVVRDYALLPSSRRTIVAGDEAELVNTSFGARVRFDAPGVAERAMYFGLNPLFIGGHESAGVTAPSTDWFLAEGATGSFFTTFILLANPDTQDAQVTVTYLPADIAPVVKSYTVPAGQRLTLNIAAEDPSLASAAVGARLQSTRPIIVERAQYWPNPFQNWYEAHNSFGLTGTGTRWGLAEGSVGGTRADQTYILLANPGTVASDVHMTFLRTNGTTVVKDFTVPATSRFNVAVAGAGSNVPELANETFGVIIDATQPIAVERSLYSNVGGLTWAAGTNATATPLSPPQPLTVTVSATDPDAGEVGPNTGTFTFTRTGSSIGASLTVAYTIGGTATNNVDYVFLSGNVTIPANQSSATVTLTPRSENVSEGSETATVTISPSQAYAVGTPNTATVTIGDSVATVSVSAADASASEPADTARFVFTRTNGGDISSSLNVAYTVGGTATNNTDYVFLSGNISIPANQFSATLTVTPRADNANEGAETVNVTLSPSTTYVIDQSQNTAGASLADSVTTITVSATDASASEPADTAAFVFTRTNAGDTSVSLSIAYTIDGTATNNTDYVFLSGSITIPANQFSATLTVTPRADNDDEGSETVDVTIGTSTTYHVGAPNTASATIADSVTVVSVVATDPTAEETGLETGTFTFTRTNAGDTTVGLAIAYTISGASTATNNVDYVFLSGSVTIPANSLSATVIVTPRADTTVEGPETVIVTINGSTTYRVAASPNDTATITINP